MRVFVTGATGFIGSHLVPELIGAGHQVVGLTRSDRGATALRAAGADVAHGDVNALDGLRAAVGAADAVIHTAFNHGFANMREHSENDRRVIATLGGALAGSDRPLIVTSGTGLVRRAVEGQPATETDDHPSSADLPRAATEEAADELIAAGQRVMIMRLSQVHDRATWGRISEHVRLAREHGRVVYVGEGANRLSAVHVSDAVRLYRLALEHGRSGGRYHAVAEEGIALRTVAEAIGAGLGLPVESVPSTEAASYFGPFAHLVEIDLAASSALTRAELDWHPDGPRLIDDLGHLQPAAA